MVPGGQRAAWTGSPYYGYWGHSYFGAQESDARGRLILPDKRTEVAFKASERTVLALKSRVLADSYGPGGALRNLAGLIGALKVQADSGDVAWNTIAEEYFNRVTSSPLTFDAGGRFTLNTYQVMTTYRRFLDGDMFTVLTTSQSGHARVKGYEGLCVEAGPDQKAPLWIDGVKCDIRTGFPLAYCFAERDATNEPYYSIIDATKVMHHTTQWTFSGRRGVPALAHCLNNFHDLLESDSFVKQSIKVASMIGITRRADPGPNASPFNLGVAAPLSQSVWQSPSATTNGETVPAPKVKYEEAIEGGIVSTAPFDVLHDERPHPNFMEYKRALLREAAYGLGFPFQVLYWMDDPGGAWTRTILELTAKAIADHHAQHQAPMVRRLWAYVIAMGIKRGDVPSPQRGTWTKIRLTPPRNITADLSKIGRLNIELRQHLQTTFAHLYEELGYDWESELEQTAVEARYLIDLEKKYDLPPGMLSQALLPQQAAGAMFAKEEEPAAGGVPEPAAA
jgi:hypothetical protein